MAASMTWVARSGRRVRVLRGATIAGTVLAVATATAQQPAATHGWVPIFDGRTLAGWKGAARYGIEEGSLVLRGGSASDALCTERSYGDFVLRFRASTANAGSRAEVVIRGQPTGDARGAAGPAASLAPASAGTLRDAQGRMLDSAGTDVIGRLRDGRSDARR